MITRDGPDKLVIKDGEGHSSIVLNDELIEVFQALKALGDDSAVVFDRGFHRAWTTIRVDAEEYLAYVNEINDAM